MEQEIIVIHSHEILDNIVDIVDALRNVVTPETGHTVQSVIADLLDGHSQLFNVRDFKAVVIVRIDHRPLSKVLWIEWLTGSDMGEWLGDWLAIQDKVARASGCDAIEFNGRIGYKKFEKLFKDYKPTRTVYRRVVR